MDALDLTKAPPRSPYEELGGLLMLARTIDKLRATLPGGNLGVYKIKGFSSILLETLGITEDALREVVADAWSDDEIVAWVHMHNDKAKYAEVNAMAERTIGDRITDASFIERYPIVKTLTADTTLFRMLEADDADMFAGRAPA